ncbi:SDR family oxidoreductase [Fluviibacterium sp. DFM31]|uniref:SDR family oxidoreductase n=1 Tax=Meridianimarinicoccus marinus TaxID=3231483 RepID=A0ABV3L5L4_9RHOB
MSARLDGMNIILTGGGAGIGRGILRQCVAVGAQVSVLEIDPAARARVEAEGGAFHICDVGDPAALQEAIQAIARETGPIDGLVNNAGITIQVPFEEMTIADMDLLWRVNQRAVLVASQAVAPLMRDTGGAIVNIASNHARASDSGYEAYAGTKGAIVAMTRAMTWSFGRRNVRVNALAPGLTLTEAVQAVAEESTARMDQFRAWHATNTVNSVDDIGRIAAWLLSPDSAALNGAEIIADQGMTARLGAI